MLNRIKIIHIITSLDAHGTQIMLVNLLSRMDRKKFACSVICLTHRGPMEVKIRDLGIQIESLGLKKGLPNPIAAIKMFRILRKRKPDIIQSWLYHSDLFASLIAKTFQAGQVVWNIRCSNMDLQQYRRLTSWTLKACVKLSSLPTLVIMNSYAAKEFHLELGYRPKRLEIIPNGFDVDRFKPDPMARRKIRKELGTSENVQLVGLVARFDPMKDHKTFLESAARVSAVLPNVRFLLCGEGVSKKNHELGKQIEGLKLQKKIYLLGPREDIPEIIASLDISCSSSYGESFPNVIGEAMACGICCVATDVGDSARIVGETGIVVPAKDPKSFAHGILKLLSLSPMERKTLGEKARKRVIERYSIEKVVKQYEKIYLDLV